MSLHHRTPLLLSTLAAALLAACGGGSSPAPAAPEGAVISGRAVDGPLAGATACYDLNDNGICDSGEPVSDATAADGSFRINVAAAEAGRHAVVVDVPANAVDADTNAAVGTAFTLRAPATGSSGSHAVFVSPLTTLVHAHMAASGATREQAVDFVQQQAGTGLSPLADFTQDSSSAAVLTARVARLAQLTANEQRNTLAAVVGTPDRDGNPVSSADLDREVLGSVLAGLPLVAGTLTDPGLTSATGATLQALLRVAARSIALQLDLTADSVRMASTMQRLAEPPTPATPEATAVLRTLRYTSSEDFFYRIHQSSAADTVVDANGYQRFYDWYVTGTPNATTGTSVTTSGVIATTGTATAPTHWNGSAWVSRAANDRFLTRLRDSQGRHDYNYGDGFEIGTGIRRVEDISGDTLEHVVRAKIRRFPGTVSGVTFANWGPSNLSTYGTATFPTGSYLIYQTNTPTSTAINYTPTNTVRVFSAAIAAGGDARSTPSVACNDTAANLNATLTVAATLEDLMARNRGTPCTFAQSVSASATSLDPNEWWGNSTVTLGTLASTNTLPNGTGSFYSTTANLRVAFAASGNRATFYRCYTRASDGSPRNCSVLGLGTWSIQTLGDARVLGFSTAPALAQRLGFVRYYVERGGQVMFATKNPVGVATTDVRLNLAAANAVFFQLGLPRVKPITEPGTATGARAAALATLQGAWGDADATEGLVWRFGPNGRFFMASAKPFDSTFREQSGAELGWFDYDPTGQYFSTLLEVDSNLTSGTSHPSANEMFQPFTITPTQISGGTGTNAITINRLPTQVSSTNLVGMWGFGSATDLSAPHLVFFGNGKSMVITHISDVLCTAANQCPPGVEFSDYSYDAATGTLTFSNKLYDTNGCDGAFDTCAAGSNNTTHTVNVRISADGQSALLTSASGDTSTLVRIKDVGLTGVPLTDDAQIWSDFPTTNYGNDTGISAASTGTATVTALFQVPLADVPSAASRVYLNLDVELCPSTAPTASFEVHRVTSAWQEGTVTWNTRPGIDTTTAWGQASFARTTVGIVRFDITSLVQAWRAGQFTNHGLAVNSSASTNSDCDFASAERQMNVTNQPNTRAQPFISWD